MLLCNSRGYCWCKIQSEGFFFHMELGFFFFLLIFWSFETVDMLLRSHLWVAASYSSHPFMDLLSSFVDNPLIKYECFLVIVSVKKKKKKVLQRCVFWYTFFSFSVVERLFLLCSRDSFPESFSSGDKVWKRTVMVWGQSCNYSISFVGQPYNNLSSVLVTVSLHSFWLLFTRVVFYLNVDRCAAFKEC